MTEQPRKKEDGAPGKVRRQSSPPNTPDKYNATDVESTPATIGKSHALAKANGASRPHPKASGKPGHDSVLYKVWRKYYTLGYSPLGTHPCDVTINGKKRDKSPVMYRWQEFCDRQPDPREIRATLDIQPRAQIGVAGGYQRFVALDVDTEDERIKAVIRKFMAGFFPDAWLRLGNRERIGAYLFRWESDDPPWLRYVDSDGATIFELIGKGRQIIIPPSQHHSGVAYEFSNGEKLPPQVDGLPILSMQYVKLLVAEIRNAGIQVEEFYTNSLKDEMPTEAELYAFVKLIPGKKAAALTIEYLKENAPIAIHTPQVHNGHHTACRVWQRCADIGCPVGSITALMFSYWSPRCDPPWDSYDELFVEVQGLLNSRRSPIGISNPDRLGPMYCEDASDPTPTQAAGSDGDDATPATPGSEPLLADLDKADDAEEKVVINPTPYSWRDPTTIPSRDFLYGKHYIRGFVSTTIAPGAAGKSALIVAESLSMVSGLALLHGIKPLRPLNVWWFNGEDPPDELDRRVAATVQRYGVTRDACPGQLYVDSGRKRNLAIVETTLEGTNIVRPVVDALVAAIIERKIDVFTVDPFVSCHHVSENDNNAIDVVMKAWAGIAEKCNCAVELVHHARKTNGADVGVEDSRGASAQVAAARDVRTLNRMTADEAKKAGVANHQLYFRIDANGKSNMSPPASGATWFFLQSIDLNNPTDGRPSDKVGVPEGWVWPQPGEGVTEEHRHAVQVLVAQGVADGQPWRENVQTLKNGTWVGCAVARVLGLNVDNPMDKAKIVGLLKEWLESGVLSRTETAINDKGKKVPTIGVGTWVRRGPEGFTPHLE